MGKWLLSAISVVITSQVVCPPGGGEGSVQAWSWRGRPCARSRHSTPPAHAGHSGAPLPWKRLYLDFWVHYFHKSHFLNELPLNQNMMLVNSKLPKTYEIFTETSDFVFFSMVPLCILAEIQVTDWWNLVSCFTLFYSILLNRIRCLYENIKSFG